MPRLKLQGSSTCKDFGPATGCFAHEFVVSVRAALGECLADHLKCEGAEAYQLVPFPDA